MAALHVLRVFCGEDGSGGNALGVFLDGALIAPERRQQVAAELGFSETVFVDDAQRGVLRIHTPTVELPFAGHPTVGTSWLLARERAPVEVLRPPAGELPVRYEGERAFVAGDPGWPPRYDLVELDSPAAVETLDGPPSGGEMDVAWAWLDKPAGIVRVRVFPLAIGIAEDEATGSAAVQLSAALGRAIDIRQGRGSRILARPTADGRVEIGGHSVLDEVRDHPTPLAT